MNAPPPLPYENEVYCPSVDTCAWCSDGECGGISCIAKLDPDDLADHEEIERLHKVLRAGLVLIQANDVLARAENRSYTPR